MSDSELHDRMLGLAAQMAIEGMNAGHGGPFGAIVARAGEVLGSGSNCVTSRNDPTAHAEIVAIRQACTRLGRFDLAGCMLYTSCEPCPMCLGAIYWARLDAVFYANSRRDAAAIGFDDEHIYRQFTLPIQDRAIRFVHRPSAEAAAAFAAWTTKPDKIAY